MPRRTEEFLEGQLTSDIIGAMYESHQEFGFGYRELVYSRAIEVLLTAIGHRIDREVSVTVYFRGMALARQVVDMIVDDKVLIEIKATERLHPAGTSQLFSYLCATTLGIGLLLHFGREARAHRVICENRFKRHGRSHRDHDAIADRARINDSEVVPYPIVRRP